MSRLVLLVGSFSVSWALLGVWGSLRQEMLIEREKGTEVPEADLGLQRKRDTHTYPGLHNACKDTPVDILTFWRGLCKHKWF